MILILNRILVYSDGYVKFAGHKKFRCCGKIPQTFLSSIVLLSWHRRNNPDDYRDKISLIRTK